jgi:hypothetical protein
MDGRDASLLVHIETTKLTANALDRASTGFRVGAVIPLFGVWRTMTQGSADLPAEAWILGVSTAGYLFVAAVLHRGARMVSRELKS